jgi:hypothetical protein
MLMYIVLPAFINRNKERDYSLATCLQEVNPKADTRDQLRHTRFLSYERILYGIKCKCHFNLLCKLTKRKTYLNQEKDNLTPNQEKEYLIRRGKDCNCNLG